MNRSAIIRNNARLVRQHVRGKTKAERQAIYSLISAGPLGLLAQAAAMIVNAQKNVQVNISTSDDGHAMVMRDIELGARARTEHRFRL